MSGLHGRVWPGMADCYNWVEPTAHALMALKLPDLDNENLAEFSVLHANQFLLEHATEFTEAFRNERRLI